MYAFTYNAYVLHGPGPGLAPWRRGLPPSLTPSSFQPNEFEISPNEFEFSPNEFEFELKCAPPNEFEI